ncbi:probable RNA-directed DNA polymerase from transposon BS [Trichonephila clavipes]|uniref:Probable RNA-directed DNA polymerase from transposon BS n=1 Tax=Trichonephila clavipes TaxID=2585209 RepID=A0A8X7BDR3_TRICX|nr:probable RNA-directed DNA polymerase from transposon BS [Trichonephila clavipes]
MNWLIENKKLHFYQTAFRTHHSITDQLFYLSQSIIDGFQEKPHKKTLAVFLDILAAFDRVWRQKLVHTIQGTGINGKALLWINDFLRGRKFSVRFNGALSESRRMWAGVPQGSVLSPLLFLIFMNTIHHHIHPDTKIACYADDIAVWHSHNDITESEKALNTTLKEYATPIRTPASISVKQKLDSVQHRAAKIIIGAVSSTNNEKAEQECGLPPPESRNNLATIKFTNKLHSYDLDHISRRVFDKWKHSTRLKRSSTLQPDSEIRKGGMFNLKHSSLEFLQEPLIPKNPPKNTCFELELLRPCSKKEDPVTLRQKGLETIEILSQDNFAITYTDASSAMVPESSSSQMRSHLPDSEAWRVVGRLEVGQTQAEVAQAIGVSQSGISSIWNHFLETGSAGRRPGQGRRRATTPNEDRYLVLTARRHRNMNATLLQQHLRSATGTMVSTQTVRTSSMV